jgi:hypothetical protein
VPLVAIASPGVLAVAGAMAAAVAVDVAGIVPGYGGEGLGSLARLCWSKWKGWPAESQACQFGWSTAFIILCSPAGPSGEARWLILRFLMTVPTGKQSLEYPEGNSSMTAMRVAVELKLLAARTVRLWEARLMTVP